MAHLPLRQKSDFPKEYQYLLDEEALGELNLFQVVGHSPEILKSLMKMASTLWEYSAIDEDAREALTLVVAHEVKSEYEWHQHVRIAMDCGVTTDDILAISNMEYDDVESVNSDLIDFTLAFVRDEVTGEAIESLENHYSHETIVGVAMLVNHYVSIAKFINNMDIGLQEEFVGWQLEHR